MPMKPGISTSCLYPMETKEALKTIVPFGIENVEIFINTFSEFEKSYCKELYEIAHSSGTKILSVHPFTSGMEPMLLFTEYERRFWDGLELYKRFFEQAAMMEAEIFVIHGDRVNSFLPQEEYFERFAKLMEIGKEFGLTVAQENVARCQSRSPDFLGNMKKAIPQVPFVLDLKQALRSGCTVKQVLEVMGENIVHIHLSDHNHKCDCMPLGDGIEDFEKFKEELISLNYTNGLILELYSTDFQNIVTLYNSYKIIKQILCKE